MYAGETVTCELEVETVVERDDRYDLTTSAACEDEDGDAVLTGTVEGPIRK